MLQQKQVPTYNIKDPVYSNLIKWRVELIEQWLKPPITNVLEIGTGSYPFALQLPGISGIEFTGLEPDEAMSIEAFKAVAGKFKNTRVVKSKWDSATADAMVEQFDLVMGFEVYEHLPKASNFLANVYKVLKPGGLVMLETPNIQVTPLFEKVWGHKPNGAGSYAGNAHVNEVGFKELFEDFKHNNFKIENFDCYYLPVTLWHDSTLAPEVQQQLYELVHKAAGMFPFYAYIQCWLARK